MHRLGLLEDAVVDRPHDIAQVVALLVGDAGEAALVGPLRVALDGGARHLEDEAEQLGHEAEVARLAPHEEVPGRKAADMSRLAVRRKLSAPEKGRVASGNALDAAARKAQAEKKIEEKLIAAHKRSNDMIGKVLANDPELRRYVTANTQPESITNASIAEAAVGQGSDDLLEIPSFLKRS